MAGEGGTRHAYASAAGAFNRWLTGRELEVGRAGEPASAMSFPDIEGLLAFCGETDRGARAVGKILRQYLAHCAASGMSVSTALLHCAAVKSYFAAHEVRLDAKVERNRHRPEGGGAEARMSLADLYKMMTAGGMDAMGRAVVMVKFQAGLDASTMADRFNFEAYGQIIRHFGTEDYEAWDLDKCPVPIRLVRVKTNMRHTTFLDRDAVSCLRDYLRQKEFRGGRHERDQPLFVNGRGRPVDPAWVSRVFSRAAGRAGIQARISRGALMVGSHEARDLLKSTLMVAGCAPVRGRPRPGPRPPGQLREAGRPVPGGDPARVRQGVGGAQPDERRREVPGVDGGGRRPPGGGEPLWGGGAAALRPGHPGPAGAGAGGPPGDG